MPRANVIQTNFTSGEISPRLYGRVDITKYFNGAQSLKNMIVRPQGGITRRNGTYFLGFANNEANKVTVRRFVPNQNESFWIEFGQGYARVWSGISVVQTVNGCPWTGAQCPALRFTQSADTLYIAHPALPPMMIQRISGTWTFNYYGFFDGPYLDFDKSGTRISYTSTGDSINLYSKSGSLWIGGDVGTYIPYYDGNVIKLAQITALISGTQVQCTPLDNTIYPAPSVQLVMSGSNVVASLSGVFQPGYNNAYIRLTDGTWRLTTAAGFVNDTHFTCTSASALTLASSHDPGTYVWDGKRNVTGVLTASSGIFSSADTNPARWIRLYFGSAIVACQVSAYTSATQVSVTVRTDIGSVTVPRSEYDQGLYYNGGTADAFRLGQWNAALGYPSVVCLHEQRLIWGNSSSFPTNLWFSQAGDYLNHGPSEFDSSVNDTDAINYVIASSAVNPITWLESGPQLLIGTIGAEYLCRAQNLGQPITPTSIDVKIQTGFGSVQTEAGQRIGNTVLFLQRGGNRVREMIYDFTIDAYTSHESSILSEHILRWRLGGQTFTIQHEPISIIWFTTGNGELVGMTYDRDQEIVAFHTHQLGGLNVRVESITSVPTPAGTELVIMVVQRTINGFVRRTLEYFYPELEPATGLTPSGQFFTDCSRVLTPADGTYGVWQDLTHLIGDTVKILADGVYVGTAVVQNSFGTGVITLPNGLTASTVIAGYGNRALVTTIDYEGGSGAGTSQGKKKRISQIDLRLNNTYVNFSYGEDTTKFLTENQPQTWFTGDYRISLDDGYDNGATLTIFQDMPVPLSIVALMPMLNTYE